MTAVPRPVRSSAGWWIHPADRITYALAVEVVGRSAGYLRQASRRGDLVCMRDPVDRRRVWLSLYDCEALALADARVVRRTGYWITISEAAARLGIARTNAYRARSRGRLPASRTGDGGILVRRRDVDALLLLRG